MPLEGKSTRGTVTIMGLLRPHRRALTVGLLAIAGESVADILQPWPLKVVLDNVISHKGEHGWLTGLIHRKIGFDPLHILFAACIAVLVIALLDAVCTYGEKWVTTTV